MKTVFEKQNLAYQAEPYMPVSERIKHLKAIKQWLQNNPERIAKVIAADFKHRSYDETYLLEVNSSIQSINYALKNIKRWVKPRKREVPWHMLPATAFIMPQPLGVVGIIVPWNYPLFLAISPIVMALAAGNRIMVKMSEYSPALGELLVAALKECDIDESLIAIINGDVEVAKQFTQLPFKHLLFTGSTSVGKVVMKAASENLTPVTLELGGKSPVIISKDVDNRALMRLFAGKLFNAGQTCIAPDYLFIPRGMEERIEALFLKFVKDKYPSIEKNNDYTCIISQAQRQRLAHYLEDAKVKEARIVKYGQFDEDSQKLPPCILFDVTEDMLIMQQEIFGPLLPVMNYDKFDEVIEYVNRHDNPLALYYFGYEHHEKEALLNNTLSGALTINDVLMHVAVDDLPFGGVGASGMGRYHGVEGFNTFSQLKPVFKQTRMTQMAWLYPPYGKLLRKALRLIAGLQFK